MDLFDADRTEMLRDFAGPLYSPYNPRLIPRYVNRLNRTATTYTTWCAFNNPKCKIDSFDQSLWPECLRLQGAVNKSVKNIDFKTTLRECVLDAFFLMACAKVRMADAGVKQVDGFPNLWMDMGKPWVDRISFSDLILDLPGKSLRSMRFYGDRYRANWNEVRERDDYDSNVRAKIAASSKNNINMAGDRGDLIALGNAVDDDELEPQCWLMDLYLPRERLFVTMSADSEGLAPLKVQEWDGSEMGPYKFLTFGYVPDNVIPSTPAQQLILLDRLMNILYGTLADQAKAQKNITLLAKGDEDIGEAIKDAANNEYRMVRDPKATMQYKTPGPDGGVVAFFLSAAEIYNELANNERVLAGLATEADTATQEQMLKSGAQGGLAGIKGAVEQFCSDVLREIGGLLWKDQHNKIPNSYEIENTGYYLPPKSASWGPGKRKGIFDHYDFSVVTNSTVYRSPEQILTVVKQFAADYLQMLPAIQAGVFDGEAFTRMYAEATDIPDILRLAKAVTPGMDGANAGGAGDPHEATKAPNTTRTVERRSGGSGAPKGTGMSQVLSQIMQGNKSNGAKQGAGV